jgi:mono/diheme cytochrome c family protein
MRRASILLPVVFTILLTIAAGCGKDPNKMTDAELGLNQEQARGRRLYNIHCIDCHPAYSSRGNKGPGLKGLYKKPYLPSGLTATDEHVSQSIVQGRGMMPATPQLSPQDLQELIAYLHTL